MFHWKRLLSNQGIYIHYPSLRFAKHADNSFHYPPTFPLEMIRIRQACYVVAFAVLLQAWGVSAQLLKRVPSNPPDRRQIELFTSEAWMPDSSPDSKTPISDRITDGLRTGPKRLILPDSTSIYWGYTYKDAMDQSVAILDPNNRLKLLAAVYDVPWCAPFDCEPINSTAVFKEDLEGSFSPNVYVFVNNRRDLETYLPYLKRWLHADLLGFSLDCNKHRMRMTAACKFVRQIKVTQIPIRAYEVPSMQPLALPKVSAANVPLDAFTQ